MVPDNLSNRAVYESQFHIIVCCCKSSLYAEHGGTFPPRSLEDRDMILNWVYGYMWHLGVRFHWSHNVQRRCRNTEPQTVHLNKSCQLDTLETGLAVKELWLTKSKNSTWQPPTMTESKCLWAQFWTWAPSYLLSAGISALLWGDCGGFVKWFFIKVPHTKLTFQFSLNLWYEVAWIVQLHLDFSLIGSPAFIQNETHRTFKGWNVWRFEMMIKGQSRGRSKYILNLLIVVVRDEHDWLTDRSQISFCGYE